jgi:hypothetical protein
MLRSVHPTRSPPDGYVLTGRWKTCLPLVRRHKNVILMVVNDR